MSTDSSKLDDSAVRNGARFQFGNVAMPNTNGTHKPRKTIRRSKVQPPLLPFEGDAELQPEGSLSSPGASESSQSNQGLLTALLGLSTVKSVGFATLRALFASEFLKEYQSLEPEDIRQRLDSLRPRLSGDAVDVIADSRSQILERGDEIAKRTLESGIHFVHYYDGAYPKSLRELDDPPHWLFIQGSVEILKSEFSLAIVGTRDASDEGKKVAHRCGQEFALRDYVVVSGLAKGIDEQAHEGALSFYGRSIAVLGHGLNAEESYTNFELARKIVKYGGALVSEYLPSEPPRKENYLRRNEIIAALSKVVIPVETPSLTSGTGSTIRRAQRLKRYIIGVIPANTMLHSLLETRERLRELDLPVFTIMGEDSSALWNFINSVFPMNQWHEDISSKKERMLLKFARQFVVTNSTWNLSDSDVDLLAEYIKRLMA